MRRFVALLILFLLPLQWSYAAVAEYCQHEEVVAAQNHVGHHAHKHADKSHQGNEKKNGFGDWDCPACHHSTPAALINVTQTALPLVAVAQIIFFSQKIPQRSPENPFRPPHLA